MQLRGALERRPRDRTVRMSTNYFMCNKQKKIKKNEIRHTKDCLGVQKNIDFFNEKYI